MADITVSVKFKSVHVQLLKDAIDNDPEVKDAEGTYKQKFSGLVSQWCRDYVKKIKNNTGVTSLHAKYNADVNALKAEELPEDMTEVA